MPEGIQCPLCLNAPEKRNSQMIHHFGRNELECIQCGHIIKLDDTRT